MPNLKGLGLQNFRTFSTKEILEFAPITLITGTNNAGKSSVFKAIKFLVHNYENGIVSEDLDFKGMRHELGDLERMVNHGVMSKFKISDNPKNQSMYSRISDFKNESKGDKIKVPIFETPEDLVFAFPIFIGSGREIPASFEIRYDLNRVIREATPIEKWVSHSIKSIAIVKDREYLHWSNLIGYYENYEDGPNWTVYTSIDLQKIIELLSTAPLIDRENREPDQELEEYLTLDLFARIKESGNVEFNRPLFNSRSDVYEDFFKQLSEAKYLFSDYSNVEDAEKNKLLAIQESVTDELLKGKDNNLSDATESFKNNFCSVFGGMDRDIIRAELQEKLSDKESNGNDESNIRDLFKSPLPNSTPNSEIFKSLLDGIENDFFRSVGKTFESLKKIYFLPTTRGRNREWFIDEQNSEDIQIARDFSAIYFKHHKQIQNFVNFWIGKGEIVEEGQKKQKGFNVGRELSVFRDETIGLTKIFLVNFDGSKTPLVDLGYGVSQLLPIIMKIAIVARKQERIHEYNHDEFNSSYQTATYFSPSTLLIEEPEANLHPSLQSKIAEMFIDAASRFNIQFLLETHSEYLIYKFQEYIGEKIISPNDIKLYYFNHPNDVEGGIKDKYVNEVKIDDDGSIEYDKYFGQGFFDEQTNLKLSLLNIQRNRFVEDFESTKNDLIRSGQILKEYDFTIGELEQQLSSATSGKEELEKQLLELRGQKERKELDLQTLIDEQVRQIDEYASKANHSNYLRDIQAIINPSKIDNSKTLKYLATGKFLLNTMDVSADFAPVVMQYGRAVEFQMIKWISDFRNSLSSTDVNTWTTDIYYRNKLDAIFISLGIPHSGTETIVLDRGTINEKKICFFHLRTFTKTAPVKYNFGDLTQIFELFYYISLRQRTQITITPPYL